MRVSWIYLRLVACAAQDVEAGDTTTIVETPLAVTERVEGVPTGGIAEVVGDSGYWSNETVAALADIRLRGYVSGPGRRFLSGLRVRQGSSTLARPRYTRRRSGTDCWPAGGLASVAPPAAGASLACFWASRQCSRRRGVVHQRDAQPGVAAVSRLRRAWFQADGRPAREGSRVRMRRIPRPGSNAAARRHIGGTPEAT